VCEIVLPSASLGVPNLNASTQENTLVGRIREAMIYLLGRKISRFWQGRLIIQKRFSESYR
jgi:hypothetical protein